MNQNSASPATSTIGCDTDRRWASALRPATAISSPAIRSSAWPIPLAYPSRRWPFVQPLCSTRARHEFGCYSAVDPPLQMRRVVIPLHRDLGNGVLDLAEIVCCQLYVIRSDSLHDPSQQERKAPYGRSSVLIARRSSIAR